MYNLSFQGCVLSEVKVQISATTVVEFYGESGEILKKDEKFATKIQDLEARPTIIVCAA